MTRIRKLSTMLISALALSAIILTAGALGPNTPAAKAAAQSGASCNQAIKGSLGIQVPTKSAKNTADARNCLVGMKNNGEAVKALQRSLQYCYNQSLAPYGIDGAFGNVTRSALVVAQGRMGTKADGIYGIDTHNKMSFFISYTKSGSYYITLCATDPVKV